MADVPPRVLVEALTDDNLFWRLTAQRLLVETNPGEVDSLLRTMMAKGGKGAPHALWALHGMEQLDYDTHQAALLSRDLVLKRNAVQALGTTEVDLQLFLDTAVFTNKDPHVRRVAFSKLAHFPPHQALKAAIPALFKDPVNRNNEWLSLALQAAAANQGIELLGEEPGRNLAPTSGTEMEGDADRGRKMFATHEIAACSRCHKVDGSGGDIGPALDGIASRKPSDYLMESLVDPQATMAEGYTVEVSPMPPYGVLLSQREIADLLAYLNSLD